MRGKRTTITMIEGDNVKSVSRDKKYPWPPKDKSNMNTDLERMHSDFAKTAPVKRLKLPAKDLDRNLPHRATAFEGRSPKESTKRRASGGPLKPAHRDLGGLISGAAQYAPLAMDLASMLKTGGEVHKKRSTGGTIKIKHPGALHRELGIAKGKKIPVKRLESVKKTGDALEKKRATFALNARKWNHK